MLHRTIQVCNREGRLEANDPLGKPDYTSGSVGKVAGHRSDMSDELTPETFNFSPLLDPRKSNNPELIALYDWWLAQREPDRRMPAWSAVDITELKPWMGWLTIYGLLPDRSDAKYRLVGSNFTEAAGYDMQGKMLSEGSYTLTPEIVLANLCRISDHGHACVQENPLEITPTRYARPSQRLWMPFSEDDRIVERILLYYSQVEIMVPPYSPGRDH